MNYIRHLHAFYHQVKHDNRLTSGHVSLYLALFQYWNYNRFQIPFPIDRDDLMQLSKIGSKNTYHKCMKDLHSFQYIIYHSGIKKYQNAKVSMLRMDIKNDEQAHSQLDLFSEKEIELIDPFPDAKSEVEPTANTEVFVEPAGTEIDTYVCTKCDIQQCPKNGTARVPNLIDKCPINEPLYVPKMGHNIKHKQINSKQCVCKTGKHTPTIIFEKNKNLSNAVSKLGSVNWPEKKKKRMPAAAKVLYPLLNKS